MYHNCHSRFVGMKSYEMTHHIFDVDFTIINQFFFKSLRLIVFLYSFYSYLFKIEMDLTQLFKATVRTVRLKNKSVLQSDKTRILKVKTRDEFTKKAKDIKYQLTQLRDLLVENRSAYMRFGLHLKSASQMTDQERNIIDEESEKILSLCNQYLNDLKTECISHSTKQCIHHKLAILDILSSFLKDVLHMHSDQKKSRIQHEQDTYKLLKLESMRANHEEHFKYEQPKCVGAIKTLKENECEASSRNSNIQHTLKTFRSDVAIDEDQASKFAISDDLDKFSSDDVQMFEPENVQLLNDLKGLSEEVEQIQKNVVDIARLQEIFTEKVHQHFIYTSL